MINQKSGDREVWYGELGKNGGMVVRIMCQHSVGKQRQYNVGDGESRAVLRKNKM